MGGPKAHKSEHQAGGQAEDDPKYLYRFRPLERVLKEGELERQELYFASLEELNDPMEGFLNLVWQGDEIIWRNLLRQYLLCLDRVLLLLANGGKDQEISTKHFDVYSGIEDLPTDKARIKFAEICSKFFADQQVRNLLKFLGLNSRRVRRSELLFYLVSVHHWAVEVILSIQGLEVEMPKGVGHKHFTEEFFNGLDNADADESAVLFDIAAEYAEDGALLGCYLAGPSSNDARSGTCQWKWDTFVERLA